MNAKIIISILLLSCFTFVNCSIENDSEAVQNLDTSNVPVSERFVPSATGVCYLDTALIAGQHSEAGTVTYSVSNNNLVVTYTTNYEEGVGGWKMTKTHLYVGETGGIPTNGQGNPKVGQFPYKSNESGGATEVQFMINLNEIPESGEIAAHADVSLYDVAGNVIQSESAWGAGDEIIGGGSWATFFTYDINGCNQ